MNHYTYVGGGPSVGVNGRVTFHPDVEEEPYGDEGTGRDRGPGRPTGESQYSRDVTRLTCVIDECPPHLYLCLSLFRLRFTVLSVSTPASSLSRETTPHQVLLETSPQPGVFTVS